MTRVKQRPQQLFTASAYLSTVATTLFLSNEKPHKPTYHCQICTANPPPPPPALVSVLSQGRWSRTVTIFIRLLHFCYGRFWVRVRAGWDGLTAHFPVQSAGLCLAPSGRGSPHPPTFDRRQFAVVFICSAGAKAKISLQKVCAAATMWEQGRLLVCCSVGSPGCSREDEECAELDEAPGSFDDTRL